MIERITRTRSAVGAFAAALCVVGLAACEGPRSEGDAPALVDGGKPKIEIVGGDTVKWGDIAPGILKKDITIKNVGGDTLKIEDAKPSCGCTTAPLEKKELAPGETTTLHVTLDVQSSSGPVHKSLTVTSNDPDRPQISMSLLANLVRDVTADPNFFPVLQGLAVGREDSSAIQLKNTSKAPVTINRPTIAEASQMAVRFSLNGPVTLQPGDSTRLVAYVKPLSEGVFTTDVVIPSDSKNSPELKVKLTAGAGK